MGRLTKEMKKAELMEQLTEANEAYLEKISQHMECQYREMQRVEQRIERKKKLIDKKYIVSIKKLEKERKEKLKKIVRRYRRIKEKVREATIDKVDLAEIENIEKEYITLRQFLLNILRERETGKLPNWKERITERSVESEISTDGGAAVSKLRALQYEFTSKFNFVMGQMPDSDVPAYSYLSRGGYIYLTEQNCEFFKLFMGNDEDCEYIEYDIIGCIKSKKVEELDERVKDQIKEGMSANVETMFSVRETPWHGLGRIVMDAPASREALELAGLDWQVESRNIYSGTGAMIPGYRANVRSTDDAVLGVVSDRYRIVQNEEAFQFTDDLLGEGVTYETAGSLQGGKKVWMLAKLPEKYIIAGDEVTPYLVFFNSHDGSSGVKVAMTPVRVVCQNTLNLALGTAKRIWTARHTENVLLRVQDARETLQLANSYMGELGKGIHELTTIKLSDRKVQEFINEFFPVTEDLTDGQRKNNLRMQDDLKARYYNAPDLEWVGKNGWRFVNAVSDFATHADPIRKTRNYNENLFLRTAEGNPMIDKAYKMVLAAA